MFIENVLEFHFVINDIDSDVSESRERRLLIVSHLSLAFGWTWPS